MDKDRVLLRMPATWAAIQAAKQLEAAGIACHLTLVYRCGCRRVRAVASVAGVASLLMLLGLCACRLGAPHSVAAPHLPLPRLPPATRPPTCPQLCAGRGCGAGGVQRGAAQRGAPARLVQPQPRRAARRQRAPTLAPGCPLGRSIGRCLARMPACRLPRKRDTAPPHTSAACRCPAGADRGVGHGARRLRRPAGQPGAAAGGAHLQLCAGVWGEGGRGCRWVGRV